VKRTDTAVSLQLSSDHVGSVRARDWSDGSSPGSVLMEDKSSAYKRAAKVGAGLAVTCTQDSPSDGARGRLSVTRYCDPPGKA